MTLTFDFKRKLHDVQPAWTAYLTLLEESSVMLKQKKANIRLLCPGKIFVDAEPIASSFLAGGVQADATPRFDNVPRRGDGSGREVLGHRAIHV